MAKICRKYVTGNGIRSKHKRKSAANNKEIMRIGIADDGFKLKAKLTLALNGAGYEVEDFVTHELVIGDDFPDVVLPMHQNYYKLN